MLKNHTLAFRARYEGPPVVRQAPSNVLPDMRKQKFDAASFRNSFSYPPASLSACTFAVIFQCSVSGQFLAHQSSKPTDRVSAGRYFAMPNELLPSSNSISTDGRTTVSEGHRRFVCVCVSDAWSLANKSIIVRPANDAESLRQRDAHEKPASAHGVRYVYGYAAAYLSIVAGSAAGMAKAPAPWSLFWVSRHSERWHAPGLLEAGTRDE